MNKQEQVIALFQEAKKGYELIKDDLDILEKAFMNEIEPEKLEELKKRGKSVILPKKIYAKIRRILIAIMRTYFENDSLAKLKPVNPSEEDNAIIDILQKIFDLWTMKRLSTYTLLRPIIRDGLVYGTGIAKVYWSANAGLKIERVSLRDFWIDPNANNKFDMEFCVNRVITSISRLKKIYGNKKNLRNYIGAFIEGQDTFDNADLGDYSRIEVFDIYRKIKGKWYVSTMLPDYTFLRIDEELNAGLPFVIGIAEHQVDRPYEKTIKALGYPLVDLLIPLQEQYTVIVNQQFDAIDKQLNPQFLSTKQSGLSEAVLRSNKKLLQVNDLNQVRELPQPNLNQSFLTTDRIDLDAQEISGVTKLAHGLVDKGVPNTATGMTILTQETNIVIEDIIRSFNETFFEPLVKRIVNLIWMYDKNPLFYGIDRTKKLNFFVNINTGVGATNKDVQLNAITTAEQTALQNLTLALKTGDQQTAMLYRKILDELYIQKLKTINLNVIAKEMEQNLEEIEYERALNELQQSGIGANGDIRGDINQTDGAGANSENISLGWYSKWFAVAISGSI